MATALFQIYVFRVSGSVALLADTIHNFGDAVTAIPLVFAFLLSLKKPNDRFTYGYGRAEDLAGLLIVFLISLSAVIAAYEAISRLLIPQACNISLSHSRRRSFYCRLSGK
jgi:cation diffusion facilitator family transporter